MSDPDLKFMEHYIVKDKKTLTNLKHFIFIVLQKIIITFMRTIEYQAHPFHMVSPSPWPILTSMSLLALTTSGALSMHVFENIGKIFFLSLFMVIYSMCL